MELVEMWNQEVVMMMSLLEEKEETGQAEKRRLN